MTEESNFVSHLLPILKDLEPHLDSLLVIGGWVPQLHQNARGSLPWKVSPLLTTELDVLLADASPTNGTNLAESLEAAGFAVTGDPATSAVWERDVQKGERIELFVHHDGPFSSAHSIVTLPDAGGVNALALPQLDVLRHHSVVLSIDTPAGSDLPATIRVRAPDLGVFAAHKGAIFFQRPDIARRTKDLHYIVDLMQSGNEQVNQIEADLARYCSEAGAAAALTRTARNNVSLVLGQKTSYLAQNLGEAVAERSGLAVDAGLNLALGLLADFVDLIPAECG